MRTARRINRACPNHLTRAEFARLRSWTLGHYPQLGYSELLSLTDDCLAYHQRQSDLHTDWIAVCRHWVQKEMQNRGVNEHHGLMRSGYATLQKPELNRWERYQLRHGGEMHREDPRLVDRRESRQQADRD